MSRVCLGVLGLVLMAFLAGCGEEPLDEGNQGFRPTDTTSLQPLIKQMQEVGKTRAHEKIPVAKDEKEKGKGSEAKKK